MHSAPAVSFPVGRSHFQGQLLLFITLLGAGAGVLWCLTVDVIGWRQYLWFSSLLVTGLMTIDAWRRTPEAYLHWSGLSWNLQMKNTSVTGSVKVFLDFQFGLLLCVSLQHGERIWLWPERRNARPRWGALRRAVFSKNGAHSVQEIHAEMGAETVKSLER